MEQQDNIPQKSGFNKIITDIYSFVKKRKIATVITAVTVALCITVTAVYYSANNDAPDNVSSLTSETVSKYQPADVSTESEEPAKPSEVSETVSEVPKQNTVSSSKPQSSSSHAASTDAPSYNTNLDIEDNVFFDAMIYTGYNIEKHRADGNMWKYILASLKRGLGYLSDITYGGGSTGYETKNGKPDISYFEKHGLVCASYVSYVYFNYLPNVAGIDTSSLTKPVRSTSANDWYNAAKDWIKKGYSRKISFTAKDTAAAIKFTPSEDIPIGSIIAFCDWRNRSDYCSHVVIYAGYKNGYHWVFHVGNSNGPEFCAVERMKFGPDPQWPIAVITPPSNIRMSAMLEVNVTDSEGNAVSGSKVTLTSGKNGAAVSLGTTGTSGKLTKEYLSYGEYTLKFTVPEGYTAGSTEKKISLTTASNSKNTVNIVLNVKPQVSDTPEESGTSGDETDSPETDSSVPSEPADSSNVTASEDETAE